MPATTIRSTDPVVFARDSAGDLIIPRRAVSGLEAVLILVRTAWEVWRDEWFLNRDFGTEWLETEDGVVTESDALLGQPYDQAKTARVLRGRALAVNGVSDVTEFRSSFDGETRNLTVSAVIRTAFGDGPVQIVVEA